MLIYCFACLLFPWTSQTSARLLWSGVTCHMYALLILICVDSGLVETPKFSLNPWKHFATKLQHASWRVSPLVGKSFLLLGTFLLVFVHLVMISYTGDDKKTWERPIFLPGYDTCNLRSADTVLWGSSWINLWKSDSTEILKIWQYWNNYTW